MSVLAWAALIWFGAPVAFVSGAIAALIARSRKPVAVVGVAAAPWLLIATPPFNRGDLWLVVLLCAWSVGCVVPLAARHAPLPRDGANAMEADGGRRGRRAK